MTRPETNVATATDTSYLDGQAELAPPMNHNRTPKYRLRRAGGALALMSLTGLAAGCSVFGSSNNPNASASTPAAPSSSAPETSNPTTTSPAPATSPTGSESQPASAPTPASSPTRTQPEVLACTPSDISISFGPGEGAAGSVYMPIEFKNISGEPCTFYGYPGVSALNASKEEIGPAATRDAVNTPATIEVEPGAFSQAMLRITEAENYPPANCDEQQADYLRIYGPGWYTADTLPHQFQACVKVGILSVEAMTAAQSSTAS